jgi:hypothetical protein
MANTDYDVIRQKYESQRKLVQVPLDSKHDPTNNPSRVLISGYQLPLDTVTYISGKKVLAIDKILDGVSVVERIAREPYELEFECVLREKNADGQINSDYTFYIFPQQALDDIWQKIWLQDTVQQIENTYLNKLGISEMIIESITPTTYRGSKNIGLRIKGFENIPGQTLIIG